MRIRLHVNSRDFEIETPPLRSLLDVLREDLGLIGTRKGCGEGACGACTVLVGGLPVYSCLVPAGQLDGANVTTIEGLADAAVCERLQQVFRGQGGGQCGFCSSGVILAAKAFLDVHDAAGWPRGEEGGSRAGAEGERRREEPDRLRDAIRAALAGNLCRCTGYTRIIDAVAALHGGGRGRPGAELADGTDAVVFVERQEP